MKMEMRKYFRQVGERISKDLKTGCPVLVLLFVYMWICELLFDGTCGMRILTGLPCPGCGMTRAAVALFKGNYRESVSYHPLLILWILLVIWIVIRRYFMGRNLKGIFVMLGVICVITLIVYIYRMKNLFPYVEPMTYHENNLLAKIKTLF